MQEASEQQKQEFCLVRLVNLAGLACGRGNSFPVEPFYQFGGLIVFLHQDGDVGCAETPRRLLSLIVHVVLRFFEDLHGAVFRQQILDFSHDVVHDLGGAVGLRADVMPEAERSAGIDREIVRRSRRDRNERNVLLKENAVGLVRRIQVAVAEHPVDGFDHVGRASEILREGVLVVRGFFRLKIGVDVGAAESVDGLLRVADHVEKIAAARGEALVENAELEPVGVLEFVYENGRILRPDRFRQTVVLLKRRIEIPNDVVVGDHAVPVLFGLKLPSDIAVNVPAEGLPFIQRLSGGAVPVNRLGSIFRRLPERFKGFVELRVAAVETVPAELPYQAVSVLGFVRDQFRFESVAGFQCVLPEHLLAEPVNRADRHFVDGADGKL